MSTSIKEEAGLESAGGAGGAGGAPVDDDGDVKMGGMDDSEESSEEEEKRQETGKMIILFTFLRVVFAVRLIPRFRHCFNILALVSLCNFRPVICYFNMLFESFHYGAELSLTVCTSWPEGTSEASAPYQGAEGPDDS